MAKEPHVVLVLGGARSGKSAFAVDLAGRLGEPVVFVATAVARDDEMEAKVAAHRAERPENWRTIEEPRRVAAAVRAEATQARTVVVDCVSMLAANWLMGEPGASGSRAVEQPASSGVDGSIERALRTEITSLMETTAELAMNLVVVSSEVGLGVVPEYVLGRQYRELLGSANQLLAAHADTVFLMIAGIPVDVRALGASSSRWPSKIFG